MKTLAGQIGVVHHAAPWSFGSLVQHVTRSTAFHAVVAISDTHCLSPEAEGILVRPIGRFQVVTWSQFAYTDAQRDNLIDWAQARQGRPYAWLCDLVIGIHDLTHYPIPRWVAKAMSNDRSYQCSEFATSALAAAGIRIFPTKYAGEVSPADLDRYWHLQGWE